MSKNKKSIICILIIELIVIVLIILVFPSIYEYRCKNRGYKDMESALTSVANSNIRVISVSGNEDDGISYSVGASGVIFDYDNGTYYALTAYHVVKDADKERFIIATTLTPTYDEYKTEKGITGHVPLYDYYELMPEAVVEYQSEKNDLAIISFRYQEELDVAKLANDNPQKGDSIVVVGNPEDAEKFFIHTYGKIISSKVTNFETKDGQLANKVLKHSAYEAPGSSGGAVFSEQMQLIGINIGGCTDFVGRFRYGVMIPCTRVRECIGEWKKNAENE